MSTIFPPFTLPRVKSLQCTILLYFTPLPWVARGLNGVIIKILVPEPTFFGWSHKAHAVCLLQSVMLLSRLIMNAILFYAQSQQQFGTDGDLKTKNRSRSRKTPLPHGCENFERSSNPNYESKTCFVAGF